MCNRSFFIELLAGAQAGFDNLYVLAGAQSREVYHSCWLNGLKGLGGNDTTTTGGSSSGSGALGALGSLIGNAAIFIILIFCVFLR